MDAGTTEIIQRFSKSWEETIVFYNNLIDNHPGWERLIPLCFFIQKLKDAGEDKFFRLGTSTYYLIISRSVDATLRQDQKFIKIDALDNSFVVTLKDHRKMYRQYTVKELEEERITHLIKTLKDIPID